MKESSYFIKPIIFISVFKNEKLESETIFNTILKNKDPHLSYELELKAGKDIVEIDGDITGYEIQIKAIDYLSSSVLCDDRISLKTKVLSQFSMISNKSKDVRLEINYDSGHKK